MTHEEHKALKVGDVVYPIYGQDRGIRCKVKSIDEWGRICIRSDDERRLGRYGRDGGHCTPGALSLKEPSTPQRPAGVMCRHEVILLRARSKGEAIESLERALEQVKNTVWDFSKQGKNRPHRVTGLRVYYVEEGRK